ncbi:MAG: undecaprenyl-diphosphatase [Patescibacteria group bacterium]|nr:undecaprenyl-diphosphatase [Patescibacteria group bacterium]
MSFFHTIILGVIEGITEFLPISSTAHLDITRLFLGISNTDFVKSFEITIQLGAILAVVYLYREKLFSSWQYAKNILIAFIPTGLIGFLLYKIIKNFLLGNTVLSACMLVLGGVVILFFEKRSKENKENEKELDIKDIPVKKLLILGVAQAFAVVPGVSRSLAIILSGRILNIPKVTITEFSFLLAIPTMLGATVYDLYKSGFAFSQSDWGTLGIGFVFAFIVALFVVRWLINYIKNNSFEIFGWYRIIFGVLVLLFLFF